MLFVLFQVHRTTSSYALVRIQPAPERSTRHRDCKWKGLGNQIENQVRENPRTSDLKAAWQPCKIDCSGHSLVGEGEPTRAVNACRIFCGTKVWVCVSKGQLNPEHGRAVSQPGWETHGQSRGSQGCTIGESSSTRLPFTSEEVILVKRPVPGAGIVFQQLGWYQPCEPAFPSKLDGLVCGPFLSGTLPAVWMKIVFLWKYFTV